MYYDDYLVLVSTCKQTGLVQTNTKNYTNRDADLNITEGTENMFYI